ncbi:unnamed protein product [Staurois parvus]|uniref:Uncharacterized protein n=1 Tax=Staurois parvus TaxID=386267 RepID=A0ABN9AX46_9NEOB|nr:unnamed protein product [Staurois parvus]
MEPTSSVRRPEKWHMEQSVAMETAAMGGRLQGPMTHSGPGSSMRRRWQHMAKRNGLSSLN